VAAFVLVFDLLSKLWVLANIPVNTYYYPAPIPVIKKFFYIVHIHNEGAVWGIFSGYSFILGVFALITLILIFFFRHTIGLKAPMVQYAFGLLTGGIIGNLIDRFQYGYVIDFIDIHLPGYRWPAFNIADIGITTGVTLYLLYSLYETFRSKQQTSSSKQ